MPGQAIQDIAKGLATAELDVESIENINPSLTDDDQVPGVLIQALRLDDLEIRKLALQKLRKAFKDHRNTWVQSIIEAGLVPDIVALLQPEGSDTGCQQAAAWIVSNLCGGTAQQTELVVEAGAIPILVKFASTKNLEIFESSVWALGNIILETGPLRDAVVQSGVISILSSTLQDPDSSVRAKKVAVWVISSYVDPMYVSPSRGRLLFPCIVSFIRQTTLETSGTEAFEEALKALDRICRLDLPRVDFRQAGIAPLLIQLASDPSSTIEIKRRVVRCFNFLISGDDPGDTDFAIEVGIISVLLDSLAVGIQEEVFLVASNIAAGTNQQVKMLLDSGTLRPAVDILLDDSGDVTARREACWLIGTLSRKLDVDEIRKSLLYVGAVEALASALAIPDRETREVAVRGITHFLDLKPGHSGREDDEASSETIRKAIDPLKLRRARDGPDEHLQSSDLKTDCQTLLSRYFPEHSRRARV